MPDIDPNRYETASRAEALLNKLLGSPKHGLEVERIIREEMPEARTDRLNLVETVTAPVTAKVSAVETALANITKEFQDYKSGQEASAAETKLRSQLDEIRKDYSFTDEGMNKVIEKMRDDNLAHSPRAAAALVAEEMGRYKPAPVSSRNSLLSPRVDYYGLNSRESDKQWEKLQADPWAWFDDQVVETLDEFNAAA
jgi:hypothetical protein